MIDCSRQLLPFHVLFDPLHDDDDDDDAGPAGGYHHQCR